MILGMTSTECNDHIRLNGFDADASGNFLIAGYVKSTSTQCSMLNNGVSAQTGFLMHLDNKGTLPSNPVFNDADVFTVLLGTLQYMRIAKLTLATGVQTLEKSLDFYSASGATNDGFSLQIDPYNSNLYFVGTIKSSTYYASDFERYLMRFDQSLNLLLFTRVRGNSANSAYYNFGIEFTTTSIYTFDKYYTSASAYRSSVQQLLKSDLSVTSECTWYNTLSSLKRGVFRINSDQTKWYSGTYVDATNNYFSIQIGTMSTNTLISNRQLNAVILYPYMEIDPSTENIVLISIIENLIVTQSLINKGATSPNEFPRIFGKLSGSYIYYALDLDQYISTSFKLRAVTSGASITTQSNTFTDSPLASSSYFPMQDLKFSQNCALPFTITPPEVFLNATTDLDNFGQLKVTQCNGYPFTITALKNGTGATLPPDVTFDTTTKVITAKFNSNNLQNYIGGWPLRIDATLYGITGYNLGYRLAAAPDQAKVIDPTIPNHDVSSCDETPYPLFWGKGTSNMAIYYSTFDDYGNFLITGYSIKLDPFSKTDVNNENGFVSLIDQRGAIYWTYRLDDTEDATNGEYCYYAIQNGMYVWAQCNGANSLSKETHYPLLVKMHHDSGRVLYWRAVPIQAYTSYRGQVNSNRNLVLIKFDETTFRTEYAKFYSTSDTAEKQLRIYFDQTADYIFEMRNQGSSNLNQFLQIQLSTGAFLRYVNLNAGIQELHSGCFFQNDKFIVPSIASGTPSAVNIITLYKSNLSVFKDQKITFKSGYVVSNVMVATDNDNNIYISAAGTDIFFFKLNPDFSLNKQSYWEAPFDYRLTNIQFHNGNMFYVYQEDIGSTFVSSFILKESQSSGFQNLNCFDPMLLAPTDTTIYATLSQPSRTYTVMTPLDIDEVDLIFDNTNWDYFTPQYYSKDPLSTTIEVLSQIGNKAYPYTLPGNNCQGRPWSMTLMSGVTATTPTSWVVWDNVQSIIVQTNTPSYPGTLSVRLRYFDTTSGNTSLSIKDNPIFIRLVKSDNVTLSQSNISYCWQNIYPIGYSCETQGMFSNLQSFFVNKDDMNILLGGEVQSNSHHIFVIDGISDAFLQRSSETGFVEWISTYYSSHGVQDKIHSITMTGGWIYCFYSASTSVSIDIRSNGILKITYAEGKLIWARKLVVQNPIDSATLYVNVIWEMAYDPLNPSNFLANVEMLWNTNIPVSWAIMFRDDGIGLVTRFNILSKPVYALSNAIVPSQVVFHTTQNFVFISQGNFFSQNTQQDMAIMKVNSITGNVIWSRIYNNNMGPSSGSPYYASLALNTYTGYLYLGAMTTDLHLAQLDQNGSQFYFGYEQEKFISLSFGAGEMVIHRKSIKYYEQGQFECHSFSIYATNPSVQATYSLTRGISPPSQVDIDAIVVISGNQVTIPITASLFRQCQGVSMTISSIKYENGLTSSSVSQPLISISGTSSITIDARNQPPYPGFRNFIANVCTSIKNKCTDVQIPIIIYPSAVPNISRTAATKICKNNPTYPRIIGDPSPYTFIVGADIDEDNGNIIMCGANLNPKYRPQQYSGTNKDALMIMQDNNGKINWAHVMRKTSGEHNYYSDCKFIPNSYIIALALLITTPNQLVLAAFDYNSGKYIFIRQIPGAMSDIPELNKILIDTAKNVLYILYTKESYKNSILKISLAQNQPTLLYSTNIGYSTTGYQYLRSLSVPIIKDYIYAMTQVFENSKWYYIVAKIRKTDGVIENYVHHLYSDNDYWVCSCLNNEENTYSSIVDKTSGETNYYTITLRMYNDTLYPTLGKAIKIYMTQNIYHSSLDYDSQNIYLVCSFYADSYLIGKFQKNDLAIVKISTFYSPYSIFGYGISRVANDGIYMFFFQYGIQSENDASQFSMLLNKVNLDLIGTESVMINKDALYTLVTPLLTYQQVTQPIQDIVYDQIKLWPQFNQYWEYLQYPTQIKFIQPQALYQKVFKPEYDTQPKNQIIILPVSYQYTLKWPNDCVGNTLSMTWSVDKYATIPSIFSLDSSSQSSTLTVVPTNSDIGSYTIRFKFTSTVDSTVSTEDTFLVTIYPETSFDQEIIINECNMPIFPAFFDGSASVQQTSMSMDKQGNLIALCGSTVTSNNQYPSKKSSFISLYTKGMAFIFWQTIEIGIQGSEVNNCIFSDQSNLFTSIQSELDSDKSQIHLFQHSSSGQLINSKQLSHLSRALNLNYFYIDPEQEDQYIGFTMTDTQFGVHLPTQNSKSQFVILKLDSAYTPLFLRTYSATFHAQVCSFLLNKLDNTLYAVFTLEVTTWKIGAMKVSSIDGNLNWAYALSGSSSYQTISSSFPAQNEIELIANNPYVCFSMESTASTTGFELCTVLLKLLELSHLSSSYYIRFTFKVY
ncbi:cadg multi-domain protein [Stylonychia lemnae]|uniref:Cadg multi-domain protein n=1 Tax=Stylonychia lemnae TaxID=5949 RepID=A0A078ANB7_STYLE|nr:cadg multi-domain protein [Stylonychia lemnae]|eukprot:CDW83860.1 cadg multi-domain protein [Stylonychia lemnae]